uniref:Chemosensory protein 11 n=1 Tax=Streltzoviella insularis TaxID=1206366 RepID=A0A7D5YJZ6_9NEOP|nr:chemosensory protein 11 [Streltzoviella insularis]
MKLFLIAVALSMFCILVNAQTYTDKYDTINLDEVLSNKRLLGAYIKCVLEQGRCTPEGKELKSHITDALQTGCSKCTSKQRQGMKRVIKHLITYEDDSWQLLVEKYDPQRIYSHKYEKELNSL